MKKILLLAFLFISVFGFADQWAVLTYKQAIQAKRLLDQQKYIISFCGCCDDSSKDIIQIKKVMIEEWEYNDANEDFYVIKVEGQKVHNNAIFSTSVDLAYIHILNSDGLAYNVAGELSLEVQPCTAPFPHHLRIEDLKVNHTPKQQPKNYIYEHEFRYPATKPFHFIQIESLIHNSNVNELVILTVGKQEDNTALLLLTKKFKDIFKSSNESYLGGDLVLYLNNGETIHSIDNKFYDYIEGSYRAFYILSEKETEKIKNINIDKIEYTLNDKKSIQRFTAKPDRETKQEIEELFHR